ncbi:MAG TPA: ABC transporter ATP-binding protein [Lacibacter sp.]|nr:ABC transporter ATP-binding protein [Lacibacter sp.]
MVFLEVRRVVKSQNDRVAVHEISFSQKRGEKIAIAGETGCGKTSLLKIIAGLMQPDAGEVLLEGNRVEGPLERLIPGHPHIAYLSQHFELRNNYEVHELLEMAGHLNDHEIIPLFQLCRIEHLLQRKTHELSGGEKQRIGLAMQLVKKPKLLLLDEPFSNMDAIHTAEMKAVVHDIAEEKGVTVILVSHNGKDVLPWADKIFIMQNGEFVQQGTPHEIYHTPVNAYCAGLFGEYNYLSPGFFRGSDDNNDKVIIRPEQLTVSLTPGEGIKGEVLSVFFFGSYYYLRLLAGTTVIIAATQTANWTKGDTVYVDDIH